MNSSLSARKKFKKPAEPSLLLNSPSTKNACKPPITTSNMVPNKSKTASNNKPPIFTPACDFTGTAKLSNNTMIIDRNIFCVNL